VRSIAALVLALAAMLGAGVPIARAEAWKPFGHVDSVCPRCTTGPVYDTVTIRGAGEVRAVVVAENEAFIVLERFGELRAVDRSQLVGIRREVAAVRPGDYPDQILLVDHTVLAGTMTAEPAPDATTFDISVPRTPTLIHHLDRSVVAAVYRGGKRVFPAAP
jgi:hypothetical protein